MAIVAQDVISGAIINGIEKAQIDYERISGGEWVWAAAEYMLTTYIAKELGDIDGAKFVTIESNGLSSISEAGATMPGPKPRKARLRGRFDILLWWGNSTPRAVIEVKNQPGGQSGWYKDIDRITSVLKMGNGASSIKFGVFAYYFSAPNGERLSAEQRVLNKFSNVEDFVREKISHEFQVEQVVSDIHDEGEYGAWGAACLIIKLL
ncbi:hypothetical protein VRB95_02945 [Erwinia aphidicola]|jgi:hypothetical protein|uniref:Uncharacterized protein n=1 Tax=Erwinia aphidicola TaxID=68334 RepID=A0ABU8DKF8_ERWAP|nr:MULTISPECIES: hypothetical protein [Erwinia]KMV72655.1 hypothetical protein AI28_05320 [bacteria symbiont BFo1 of Frankliniella occidentalis]PIJ56192.1 hypothetical protein BOM23_17245 [Erwinia sp. OLMDLW33]KYP86737.1 hypothetical protein WB66_01680 [bacteria symbiont BFo1 of Frankliniella occidentalis]KYP92080.1 hypothetical protein WB91_02275 [bacteria symbiont BFo1 of Frankliniella occidentalis]MDI3441846.1 hypothetical protein [Erwinia sp. V90_4]